MPKFKTAKQISAEIAALTSIKPTVRHFSLFGDNHWEAIEAQITILKQALVLLDKGPGKLSPTKLCAIAEEFQEVDDDGEPTDNTNVYDEAIVACDWVCSESDNATLIENWKELVILLNAKTTKARKPATRPKAKNSNMWSFTK